MSDISDAISKQSAKIIDDAQLVATNRSDAGERLSQDAALLSRDVEQIYKGVRHNIDQYNATAATFGKPIIDLAKNNDYESWIDLRPEDNIVTLEVGKCVEDQNKRISTCTAPIAHGDSTGGHWSAVQLKGGDLGPIDKENYMPSAEYTGKK